MNRFNAPYIGWRAGVVLVAMLVASSAAPDEPSPTPSPRPGSLADYASRVTLDASLATDGSGRVLITTANLAEIAQRGSLTPGAIETDRLPESAGPSPKDRAVWRKRYLDQRRTVAALEKKRERIETEIDHLEDGRLTAAIMARIDRAENELRSLEAEIAQERDELARIVRDARLHGAEPGWFR
jgi:hypothetical protein